MASSSSSSSSSFGRLLQSARVSSWDPTIPQLYTAPAAFAVRGQYGFKRPIPVPQLSAAASGSGSSPRSASPLSKVVRARNIDLVCPDTPAGIAVWATDNTHPRFLRTFDEKAVKLLDYDPAQRREADGKARPAPATEPATIFDSATRRILPSEAAQTHGPDSDAVRQAQRGLARPYGRPASRRSAYPSTFSYSGQPLLQTEFSAASQYTSLDIVPNYARMSEKQFEAYLQKIRKKVRPALIRHLAGLDRARASAAPTAAVQAASQARAAEDLKLAEQAQGAKEGGVETEAADAHAEIAAGREPGTIPVPPQQDSAPNNNVIVDMWDASRTLSSSYTSTFIRSKMADEAVAPGSTTLPASSGNLVPVGDLAPIHQNGGLQYGSPDEIYTSRLSRPSGLPAHVLHRIDEGTRTQDYQRGARIAFSSSLTGRGGAAVSLGGHVAHLPGPTMPRMLTDLKTAYESAERAESEGAGSADKAPTTSPTHVLVRPFNAYQAETSSADRARQINQSVVPAPPTGISRTASLAAAAAGRPIGAAREHVVLPDPTSIHVRVRPVYVDEVHVPDFGPLAADPERSVPGSVAHVATLPKPLSASSGHPGVEQVWSRMLENLPNRRISRNMAADSLRVRDSNLAAAKKAGAEMSSQIASMFSEMTNVVASVSSAAAAGSTGAGGTEVPRLQKTSVGPSARRKHRSNIKK